MTAILRCAVDAHAFAMPADDVRHVTRAEQLRADDASDGRIGALMLGGQHVPVFDLGAVMGVRDSIPSHGDQHVAVTSDGDSHVGWLVDRLTRDQAAAQTRVAALPDCVGSNARRWFSGVVIGADQDALLMINPAQMFPHATNTASGHESAHVFTRAAIRGGGNREPLAVVFSTRALPPADADRFALSGRQIAAIVQPGRVIAIPGAAAHVRGLTIWRDVVVPLIDYRGAAQPGENSRWLIARCGAGAPDALVALAIDDDVVMHRPTSDDRVVSGATPLPFTNGIFEIDGDRVALLDLDALLADASTRDAA